MSNTVLTRIQLPGVYQSVGILLLYTIVTILFLLWTAIGWHLLPNGIWGLYSLTDGALAAWNSYSIFIWSKPLDPSPYNFLQGLGSLYIPNTPWLNPGALAMSLPLELHLRYYVSYAVYFLEVFVSVVVLARTLGFSTLQSVIAAQLLCLFSFPPFSNHFLTLPWISLAPFNAHVIAAFNLSLALFRVLGTLSTWKNAGAALGIVGLGISAFYSAEVTFVTFIPAYALFAVVVAAHQPTRQSIAWKIGLTVSVIMAAVLLRIPDFYLGTTQVTSSYLLTPTHTPSGIMHGAIKLWETFKTYNWCGNPQFFLCSKYPIVLIHAAGLLGALIVAIFRRGLFRWISIGMLAYIVFSYFYAVAAQAQLLNIFNRINKDFLLFSAYTFYALFAVAGVFELARAVRWLADELTLRLLPRNTSIGTMRSSGAQPTSIRLSSPFAIAGFVAATLVVPAYGTWLLFKLKEPALREIVKTLQFPPPQIYVPFPNPVTDTLIAEGGLHPGATFRGFTTTYFGASGGPLREKIGFGSQTSSSPSIIIDSRHYMHARYGNIFMMTDLWRFNVPTFEEYGQWITKQLYVFTTEMFALPGDSMSSWETRIYKLDLPLMQALGIRFIITDSELSDERLTLRAMHKVAASTPPVWPEVAHFMKEKGAILKGEPVPVRLYEIRNPNVASYSPVNITRVQTVKDIIGRLRDPEFSPETEVILQEDLGSSSLVHAAESRMEIDKGRIRVVARSKGNSLLLLPIQFSRCLTVRSRIPIESSKRPRLFRANLVETALLFDRQIDIDISFDFGPGTHARCRIADVEDYKKLDFSPWGR